MGDLPYSGLNLKDGVPLCSSIPVVYELCVEKNLTVKEFYEKRGVLNFRRWLPAILNAQWISVCEAILSAPLCEGEDEWEWKTGKNGKFLVKSMSDQLAGADNGDNMIKTKYHIKLRFFCGYCYSDKG
jgi:hypothetical protein